MERTTDLDIIRTHPGRFTWGQVLSILDIGPYTIIESLDRPASNSADKEPKVSFHVYVDGKSTHSGSPTLDGALLLAIGHKHLGPNDGRHFASFAARAAGL